MAVLANANFTSELVGLNETRKAVENAEHRARLEQRKTDSRIGRKNNREYAEALHTEADELYRKGDYESALVLYHRAANLFPRDSSHSVAARRTSATISSCNNPSKALRKAFRATNNGERLTMSLCPETAAVLANDRLKKSPNPSSVARILRYFDSHKSFWKTLPSPRSSTIQLSRSKKIANKRQIADRSLSNLQTAFNSGKITSALKIAQDLLALSAGFENPSRYQIAAYHYLSLIHVALGRHDRAVCNVSRLVRLAKSTDDEVQVYRSFVTLGKVHLSFGHLDAAAKSWEYLSKDLKEPIPVAWIRHEIGRCYLETGKYKQAMDMAVKCVEAAAKGKSKKWLLYGKLLLGISLAKQGTFVDALEELQVAAKITEEEGDTPMLSYIRNLIDQMARALRSVPLEDDCSKQRISREQIDQQQPRRSSLFVSREQTVITTMFTQRMITEYRDGFNSDASVDLDEHTDEITMHSEKTNSERSYQESPDANETVSGGGTTFRKHSRRASRCSSTSNDKFEEEEEEEEDVEEETESSGTEDDQDEGVKCASSKTSFKSANTTATYVIEGGDSKVDNGEQKGVSRMVDNAAEGSGSDKNLENSIHGDGYLHVMDQLGKMEDTELLMLLKKKLLEEDWSDFRNSGDRQECRTPRSRQDTNKVVGNH
ncbi:uncharacterized protein LOC100879090 isoform X1 [Megachile rotundata]|uniref:uncharacterized protein LOC100879090 isoform X1 n=1 Tax=Megachile rotundata TaxID=143995 RepID=UPI003FD0A0EF